MKNIKQITLMGLLLALTFSLSALETALSSALPAGVRIGLANIVVMITLLTLGKKYALTIVILKSLFIFLTKGFSAFLMSFAGGILSFAALVILIKSEKNSLSLISVISALVHNMAQLVTACFTLGSINVLWYAPVLVLAGVFAGLATGTVAGAVLPPMRKIFGKITHNQASGREIQRR